MKYLIAVAGLGVVLFFFKGLFFCLEQAVWAGDVPAQIRLGVNSSGRWRYALWLSADNWSTGALVSDELWVSDRVSEAFAKEVKARSEPFFNKIIFSHQKLWHWDLIRN